MWLRFAAIIWFTALLNASFKSTDSSKCCRHVCVQSLAQRLKYQVLTCWSWLIKCFLPTLWEFLLYFLKRVPCQRAILVQTRTSYVNNSIFSLWTWKEKHEEGNLNISNVKSLMQEGAMIQWCAMTCTVFQHSKDPTVGRTDPGPQTHKVKGWPWEKCAPIDAIATSPLEPQCGESVIYSPD